MADTSQSMSAAFKKIGVKPVRTSQHSGGYLGVTKDGVRIVRPKFSPKNFTEEQLRVAVTKVLGKSL
jgi:hypothetical protein